MIFILKFFDNILIKFSTNVSGADALAVMPIDFAFFNKLIQLISNF